MTIQSAIDLLTEALFLRQNGDYAPGGRENWRDWDVKADSYLRGWTEARMITANQLIAEVLDKAGNTVSGLRLEEIGEDGHAVANTLWKIAAYLRKRDGNENAS